MAHTKIDLVTGFLGAGKTTFIAHLLRTIAAHGESCAVIENEFGAAGVDAHRLANTGTLVREISGGCVCCTQKVSFYQAMQELAGQVDRVIVEPSGIFSPADYLSMLDSPTLADRATPGIFLCVLDPASLAHLCGDALQVLHQELSCAGGVILSHTATLPPTVVQNAGVFLRAFGFSQEDICATPWQDGIDLARVLRMTATPARIPLTTLDHSTLFQSTTLYPALLYNVHDALARVRRLSCGEGGDALRAKGCVYSAHGLLDIDMAGAFVQVRPTSATADARAYLNIIGTALNRRLLKELFP